jgi:multisubunit Na+/H+ antiporter MnhC subunit
MAIATAIHRRAVAALLIVTYIFPIVIRTVTGLNYSPFSAVWTAGLLGAMAPDILRTGWHVPHRFRYPLVCWALTVVAGTLIVVLREFDFTSTIVWSTSVANSSGGGWPSFVATWSLHTSLVLLSGMLWFDWLCGMRRTDFRPAVAIPLAASGAVMVAVAVYQLFVDLTFLNPTVYGAIGRASGTVMDANLCGTIAALWIGGAVLLIRQSSMRYQTALQLLSAAVCWLAVWASGSRTGFAAALIVSAFVGAAFWKESRGRTRAAGIAAAVAAIAVVGVFSAANVVGPLQRIRQMVPSLDAASLGAVARELWNRNGYGAIGTVMIHDHPLFGIGVGGFNFMQADFARVHGLPILPPDNAQNWYRQQLAELGVFGSAGWVWFAAAFGLFLLRGTNRDSPAHVARGMVLAFAAISLLGMPGQEVPASMTFWLAAFWNVFLADPDRSSGLSSRRTWLPLVAAVALFATGTAWIAATSLRVPARAQRFGFPYSYGFYNPKTRNFGPGPGWTGRSAVWVFEPASAWVALTVSSDYRDVSGSAFTASSGHARTRPTDVQLWCNGHPLLRTRLTTTEPHTTYLRVPAGERWIFVESSVSRGVPLRDLGIDAKGEIGVRIDWTPAAPPMGADQPAVTCGV